MPSTRSPHPCDVQRWVINALCNQFDHQRSTILSTACNAPTLPYSVARLASPAVKHFEASRQVTPMSATRRASTAVRLVRMGRRESDRLGGQRRALDFFKRSIDVFAALAGWAVHAPQTMRAATAKIERHRNPLNGGAPVDLQASASSDAAAEIGSGNCVGKWHHTNQTSRTTRRDAGNIVPRPVSVECGPPYVGNHRRPGSR